MDFIDIINNRRSINFFDAEKNVSDKHLRSIIETASKTPSGFNLQPWSIIILKDSEKKKKLQKLAWNQPKISEAPVIFIILADRDGWKEGHNFVEKTFQKMINAGSMQPQQRKWFENARTSLYGASKAKSLAFACKNTGFFAMSLMLAAKNLDIETHPMDGFDHDQVKKEFNIPDNYWVPLLLAVGYKKKDAKLDPPKWRKSYDEIVVSFD